MIFPDRLQSCRNERLSTVDIHVETTLLAEYRMVVPGVKAGCPPPNLVKRG